MSLHLHLGCHEVVRYSFAVQMNVCFSVGDTPWHGLWAKNIHLGNQFKKIIPCIHKMGELLYFIVVEIKWNHVYTGV